MAGIDHVLHVASPLGREAPRDRYALVAPARDGTLRVLHHMDLALIALEEDDR